MGTKRRKPITIQLDTETDADLLAAIAGLPIGRRNPLLKSILRAGLGLKETSASSLADEVAYLRKSLEDMPGWLEEHFAAMQAAIQRATIIQPGDGQGVVEPLVRMTDEQKLKRKENMSKLADW
jgi:hypothetical protein